MTKRGSRRVSGSQLVLGTTAGDRVIDPLSSGSTVLELVPNHLRQVVLTPPLRGRTTSRSLSVVLTGYERTTRPTLPECSDVLALPAALWCSLPRYSSLLCLPRYSELPVTITNSRPVWTAVRRLRGVVFGKEEWAFLVSIFESGRASPHDVSLWCEYKRKTPTWKLTLREALGGLPKDNLSAACPDTLLGDVLSGWDCALARVSFDHEVPTIGGAQ